MGVVSYLPAVMPPAVVMAATSTPSVVMTTSAVMAPAVSAAMTMASFDLDNTAVRGPQRTWRRYGHC
ncbi:hypothetical protein ACVIIW_000486 [Bradyrhizobium sp. USDA 4449]